MIGALEVIALSMVIGASAWFVGYLIGSHRVGRMVQEFRQLDWDSDCGLCQTNLATLTGVIGLDERLS